MSTHYDGINSTRTLLSADPLSALSPISNVGQATAILWKPLEVAPSGLIKIGSSSATVNPYSDGKIYFATVNGSFTDSASGDSGTQPGAFYAATDGWRFDMFVCRLNPDNTNQVIVRRHTYMSLMETFVHVDIRALNVADVTYADPIRVGSFTDSEAGDQLIAAEAVWATGADVLSDSDIETMINGLYAWAALSPTVLMSFEDATSLPIDVLNIGVDLTSNQGASYSTDELVGWTYSLSAPGTGNPMKVRMGGSLVDSSLSGFVRYAGALVPFGPE